MIWASVVWLTAAVRPHQAGTGADSIVAVHILDLVICTAWYALSIRSTAHFGQDFLLSDALIKVGPSDQMMTCGKQAVFLWRSYFQFGWKDT